jgi:hypothetical protein
MRFYGMKTLGGPQDWAEFVGSDKFKPGRSAYSLAHTWQGASGFPSSVAEVLAPLRLTPIRAFIEWEETLDTQKGPSVTDIMLDTEDPDGLRVPVAVEGKCAERFGEQICVWIHGGDQTKTDVAWSEPKKTRERRLNYLNEVLGTSFNGSSELRYQLVHRTASVVLRARSLGVTRAVVLIHSFSSGLEDPNFADWCRFLASLPGGQTGTKQRLLGAVPLGGIQTYFAWTEDRPVDRGDWAV